MVEHTGPTTTTGVGLKPGLSGARWRVLLSVLGPITWLVFTLLYVGFWATGFSLFQDIIVLLVSVLLLGGVMAGAWITSGTGANWRWG